jgi:hypothetical protein
LQRELTENGGERLVGEDSRPKRSWKLPVWERFQDAAYQKHPVWGRFQDAAYQKHPVWGRFQDAAYQKHPVWGRFKIQ